MKRHPRFLMVVSILSLVFFTWLASRIPDLQAATPTPEQLVLQAWQRAQESGAYHYVSEFEQTTYPAPTLSNVGRTAEVDTLYMAGDANLRERALLMTMWQQGGSVATGKQGVEVRLENGRSYGRTIGASQWEEMGDDAGAFAPNNDLLSFLAAIKNVQASGTDSRALPGATLPVPFARYTFEMDGPAFARYLRDKFEQYLADRGELPAGLTLEAANVYRDMVGAGEVWLDQAGVPARLSIKLDFPQQENGERVSVQIKSDFSNYAPLVTVSVPPDWSTAATTLVAGMARSWQKVAPLLASVLGMALFAYLLATARRRRGLSLAVTLAAIAAMVIGPLWQSQQVYAFTQRQADKQAQSQTDQDTAQTVRDAQAALYGDTGWNPNVSLTEQSTARVVSSSAVTKLPHLNAAAATTGSSTVIDTDNDGLPDDAELVLGTQPAKADSDGDGLTDGQEVIRLGTDALKIDTDRDGLTDDVEVLGFSYNGKTWYTDPTIPDTNNDGINDGVECPQQIVAADGQLSPRQANGAAAACQDTNANGVPDVFDRDNDGDGVEDRTDLSPNTKSGAYDATNPLKLTVQGVQPGRDVLIDYQLRPITPTHLNYTLNVLDWPTGDTQGQVQRVKDTTFANAQPSGSGDPRLKNGDMRLTPMLELTLYDKPGQPVPLPRTAPITVTATFATQAAVSVTLEPAGDNVTLRFSQAVTSADYLLTTGWCPSPTSAPLTTTVPAEDMMLFTNIVNGDTGTLNTKLLALADGNHSLVYRNGTTTACTTLIDLPNGLDPDRMIDANALGAYGATARDTDHNGQLAVYLPLNVINDALGGQRQAFGARMIYRLAEGQSWSQAQETRLIWMIQLLDDTNQTQVINTYQDAFTLTGLSVREDQGLKVGVAFEDPTADADVSNDSELYVVSLGLSAHFVGATPDPANPAQRALTLDRFKARFDNTSNDPAALADRWGVNGGAVKVLTYTLANQDQLGQLPTHITGEILKQYFMANEQPLAAAPTLLIAREESYRSLDLGAPEGVVIGGSTLTLNLSPDRVPPSVMTAMSWSPFRYVGGQWQSYALDQYWDVLGARLDKFIPTLPANALGLSPNQVTQEAVTGLNYATRVYYMNMVRGETRLAQRGSQLLTDTALERTLKIKEIAKTSTGLPATLGSSAGLVVEAWDKGQVHEIVTALGEKWSAGASAWSAASLEGKGWVDKIKSFYHGAFPPSNEPGLVDAIKAKWGATSGTTKLLAGAAVAVGVILVVALLMTYFSGHQALVIDLARTLSTVYSVYSAFTKASEVSVALANGGQLARAARLGAVVGVIVTSMLAIGVFVYQWASGAVTFGSVAFNQALALMVAKLIIACIAFIVPFGPVVLAVLAAIDQVLSMICKYANPDKDTWYGSLICTGLTDTAAQLIAATFYSARPLVGNLDDPARRSIADFKPALIEGPIPRGYVAGATLSYELAVKNRIILNAPSNFKELLYSWQYKVDTLKETSFQYVLAPDPIKKVATWAGEMRQQWQPAGTGKITTHGQELEREAFESPSARLSLTTTLSQPGINQPVALYLNEGRTVPLQRCVFIPPIGPIPFVLSCSIVQDDATSPIDIGADLKWDIFPATLDEFYQAWPKDGGYSLAWGQNTAITVTGSAAALTFPRMKDFDGDGLLNPADGGLDPNDSMWDADADGLSDPYEIAHNSDAALADTDGDGLNDYQENLYGTNPRNPDSDGDGLNDLAEITGWELVYGLAASGSPLKTWVRSDPLKPDVDGDGLNDLAEKSYGFNPYAKSSGKILTYSGGFNEVGGAMALLRFDETQNAAAFADSSGFGYGAVCNSGTCPTSGVQGYYGNAAQFDGATHLLAISSTLPISNASFTLAAWAKRSTPGARADMVLGQGSGAANQALAFGFRADGSFTCAFGGNDLSAAAVSDTHWHHWACAYDAAARARVLYRDGVVIAQDNNVAAYQGQGTSYISGDYAGQNRFAGLIDEVGVYNAALDASSVQAVMQGRYQYLDLQVKPGGQINYQATVKNELLNRYAQGYLNILAPSSIINAVAPLSFILQPNEASTMSGTVTVQGSAPSGAISLTQVASGQIVDWRAQSGLADLWLKFDESAGATVFADSSGSQPARNGTSLCANGQCPQIDAGRLSNALKFGGNGESVRIANASALNNTSFTLAAWIKRQNTSRMDIALSQGSALPDAGLHFGFRDSNRFTCGFWSNDLDTDQTYTDTDWHHWACTYNASTGERLIYRDGTVVARQTQGVGPYQGGGDLLIGRFAATGQAFQGWVDDARVYPVALDATKVAGLANVPVLSLTFDGSTGSYTPKLSDTSGSNYDAVCSGAQCPGSGPGIFGQALYANGSQYVKDSGANLSLKGGLFTQSVWVYPERKAVEPVEYKDCQGDTPFNLEWYSNLSFSGTPNSGGCYATTINQDLSSRYNISQRFTGKFQFNKGMWVTFGVRHDDGLIIYLDGTKVYENGAVVAQTRYPTIWIGQGQHTIRLDQWQGGGPGYFNFEWPNFEFPEGILGYDSGEAAAYPSIQRVGYNVRIGFGTGSQWLEYTFGGSPLIPQRWNHVATTFDGTIYRVYVNGQEVGNTEAFSGRRPADISQLWIGRSSDKGRVYVKGMWEDNRYAYCWTSNPKVCLAASDASGSRLIGDWKPNCQTWNSVNATQTVIDVLRLRLWIGNTIGSCGVESGWDSATAQDKTFSTYDHLPVPGAMQYDFDTRSWLSSPWLSGYWNLGTTDTNPPTPAFTHNSFPFRGAIDQVQIYRAVFSADQIAALYGGGQLALSLPLDDAPGAGRTQQGFANAVDATGASKGTCDPSAGACPVEGVPGRVNLATQFDGVNDVVSVPTAPDLSYGSFTVAVWARRDQNAAGRREMIIAQGTNSSGVQLGFRGSDGADSDKFVCAIGGFELNSPSVYTDADWHHWACAYDGSGGVMTLFRDGQMIATRWGATAYQGTGTIYVGAGLSGQSPFKGTLDEARVYRAALQQSQVYAVADAAPAVLLHLEDATTQSGLRDEALNGYRSCVTACPAPNLTGRVGLGARFTPSATIQLDNATYLGFEKGVLTAMTWVKADDWTGWQTIITNGDLRLGVKDGVPQIWSGSRQFSGNLKLLPNQWYHLTYRLSIVNGQLDYAIFVNGAASATGSLGTYTNASTATLGGLSAGVLDEVTIYKRALTNNEVLNAYQLQLRYVEERETRKIIVDADAPLSSLKSYVEGQQNYRPNQYQVLGVTTQDSTSGVAFLEVNAARAGQTGTWQSASICLDSTGNSAWCPAFDPTVSGGDGTYTLQTRATDRVGNRETPTRTYTLLVDGTPPNLATSITSNSLLAPDATWTVALSGTVSDPQLPGGVAGSGVDRVQVALSAESGALAEAGWQAATLQGTQWRVNYPFTAQPAGVYTLTAVAYDKVGNLTNANLATFRLEALPPQVTLDSPVPQTMITSTITLTGTIVETPTVPGAFFGASNVEASFTPINPALYNARSLPGQVFYLPLDDQRNPQDEVVFTDLEGRRSGLAKDGALPQAVAGHTGPAYQFSGSATSPITFTDPISLAQQSFSVAFWARRDVTGTLQIAVGQGSDAPNQGLQIGFRANDKFTCAFGSNDLDTSTAFPDTDWHHWVCTYDAAAGRRVIYRDAQSVAYQNSGVAPYAGASLLYVGSSYTGQQRWTGALDDVRVFNRALSNNEVYALYRGDAPLLRLTFDDTAEVINGARLADASGWGNGARLETTATGNHAIAGKAGAYAVQFDGQADAITTTRSIALANAAFTIGFWAKRDGLNRREMIIGQGQGGVDQLLRIGFKETNVFTCGFSNGLSTTAAYTDTDWHHWACVFDVSPLRLSIYRDGVLVAQDSVFMTMPYVGSGPLIIGAGYQVANRFKGAVDDVIVYPRALSAEEIAQLSLPGWRAATLNAGGSGVLSTTFTLTTPLGTEGDYALSLRGTDAGGNASLANNVWSAAIDSLAPRVTLTRRYDQSCSWFFSCNTTTVYDLTATDFNLTETLQFAPCALSVTERTYYNSPWYVQQTNTPKLNSLKASCQVSGQQSGAVSATGCDAFGNCGTVNLAASQRPTRSDANTDPDLFVFTPNDQAVLTHTTDVISLTGVFLAPNSARAITITADGNVISTTNWAQGAITETQFGPLNWTPAITGAHTLVVEASDWATGTVAVTRTIYVDTDTPAIGLESSPYSIWWNSNGALRFTGWLIEEGSDAQVTFDIDGPASTHNLPATIEKDQLVFDAATGDWLSAARWTVDWPVPANAPIDGEVYAVTVRAVDRAGHQITFTEPALTIDVIEPVFSAVNLTFEGVPAVVGQIVTKTVVAASFTFSITDRSSVSEIDYGWSTSPDLGDVIDWQYVFGPSADPMTLTLPLSMTVDGTPRYLILHAHDTYYNYADQVLGPYYHDRAGLPDYAGMNEPAGPYADAPYRGWMNTCTQVGFDDRLAGKPIGSTELATAQTLNVTHDQFDHALRLTWTGGDWDTDGDLFIYLDTQPDQMPDFGGTPYVQHGGNVAYNPYPATVDNTVLLLPVKEWGCGSYVTPPGWPTLNRMNADYAVWVKDAQTAVLLKWDDVASTWQPVTSPFDYRFTRDQNTDYTDLSIPLDSIGILDPAAHPIGLVAFATDDEALRVWSVLPAANPVNSQRVVASAPLVGDPQRLHLTDRYTLNLSANACYTAQGRLQTSLVSTPAGLSSSSTDDDLRLIDQPPVCSSTAFDHLYDGYDTAYQTWLTTTYCPANPDDWNCGGARSRPTTAQILQQRAAQETVSFTPLQPGQLVTYTLRYRNDTTQNYPDAWAVMSGGINRQPLDQRCQLMPLGDILAGTQGSRIITGVVGANTVESVHASLGTASSISPDPATCSFAAAEPDMFWGSVTVQHTPDRSAPTYLAFRSPSYSLISAAQTSLGGVVVDESPISNVRLRRTINGATSDNACQVDSLNAQWTCATDFTGTQPTDNVQVQVKATDPFSQATTWTGARTLYVDAAPPTVTLRSDLAITTALPLLSGVSPQIGGGLQDNFVVSGVQVCDALGGNCGYADVTLDPSTFPTTTSAYDDIPAAPIAIDAGSMAVSRLLTPNAPEVCGPGTVGVWRQFVVTDTFNLASVQVGLSVEHPVRGELAAKLWSPNGQVVNLIYTSTLRASNYDVWFTQDADQAIGVDYASHASGETFFNNVRRPAQPFMTLGGAANGAWTLIVCDLNPAANTGIYQRARLLFTADAAPRHTQATWQYALPSVENSDNAIYTSTLIGADYVGNQSVGQAFTYRVDNVPPIITLTQASAALNITPTATVLSGLVSDGSSVALSAAVTDPTGATSNQAVLLDQGAWTFDLNPTVPGDYSIVLLALDEAGNLTQSESRTVHVIAPPRVVKAVSQSQGVALGSGIVYSLTVFNDNPTLPFIHLIVTDVLPGAVTPLAQVISNTQWFSKTLVWGPLNVPAGSSQSIAVPAQVTSDPAYAVLSGIVVSNTATFAANDFGSGTSNRVDFTLLQATAQTKWTVYMPVVLKNQ